MLHVSPSNYAVVANFRKHKLPIISEEDWDFFTGDTESGCFSSGFLDGFHRVIKKGNKLFVFISHIFFFNLKCNYFMIKFVDEQSLVNPWNLTKDRFSFFCIKNILL